MHSEATALPAGFALGVYEIEARAGAGGMGAVYRARDRRLGRVVAIKVIRPGVVASSARRLRFEREARVLSGLNHPHICSLYDVGQQDGVDFLVMEYVEGLTLARHLETRRLKVAEALGFAGQIADALASAHAKGIVHRDLKPANVMVTSGGVVKLLDFGLARLTGPDTAPEDESILPTEDALTEEGAILGTLPYLSPEQAAGGPVDVRSDIFSFGSVLYEMLTGIRAFDRASPASTLAAVLGEEPRPLRDLASDVPPELERIVDRCLRKDRERRLRSMSDLALSLRELREESDSGRRVDPTAGRRRRLTGRWLRWSSVLAAALVAVGAVAAWRLRDRSGPVPARDAGRKVVPLTTDRGIQKDPSLSPDGRQVAYSWNGPDERNFDVYLKTTTGGPPLRLTTDPAEDLAPVWSPDGGSIAFMRALGADRYAVLLIPALGGPERKLGEVAIPDRAWVPLPFLSWFPDGQSLAVVDAPGGGATAVYRVSVRTGERTQITFPPPGVMGDGCVAVAPDGRTLAFGRIGQVGTWSWSIQVAAVGSDSAPAHDARPLTPEHRERDLNHALEGIAWSRDGGRVVFAAGSSLWTLAARPSSAASTPAAPTKEEVGAVVAFPSIARESDRLVYSSAFGGDYDVWRMRLARPGRKAGPPVRLLASTRLDFAPQYSPDGRRVAYESDRGGNLEIWVCNSDGGDCSALTSMGSAFTGVPRWSPDGRQVAYYSRIGGNGQIFAIGSEGGAYRQITTDSASHMFPWWSRDGRWIYFASNRTGSYQIWKAPTNGGDGVQVTRRGGFASSDSADGQWLYYTRSEAPDAGLYRMSLASGEETQVVASVVFHNYEVVRDGVYFVARAGRELSLRFLSYSDSTPRTIAPLPEGYVGLSVSPDREWVLYTAANPLGRNLSLIESFR